MPGAISVALIASGRAPAATGIGAIALGRMADTVPMQAIALSRAAIAMGRMPRATAMRAIALSRAAIGLGHMPDAKGIGAIAGHGRNSERYASELRDRAFAACDRAEWALCERMLDAAERLDPRGEDAARVVRARQAVHDALSPDASRTGK